MSRVQGLDASDGAPMSHKRRPCRTKGAHVAQKAPLSHKRRPCHTGGALVIQGAPLSYRGRPCPAETAAGVFPLSCLTAVSCWRSSPRVSSVVHMEPPTFGHAAGVGSVRSDTSQGRVHHSVMHIQPDTRQVSQQAWPRGEALIPRAWTREEGPAGP